MVTIMLLAVERKIKRKALHGDKHQPATASEHVMQFSEIFKIGAKLNIFILLIAIKLTDTYFFMIELAH